MIKANAIEREIFINNIDGYYQLILIGYLECHAFAQKYVSIDTARSEAIKLCKPLRATYTGI